MTAPPTTGIPDVDAELQVRAVPQRRGGRGYGRAPPCHLARAAAGFG
jgi:hypothetical protein